MNHIEWTVTKYSSHPGTLGGVEIFRISWNSSKSQKSEDGDYILECSLPGRTNCHKTGSLNGLKAHAELLLADWISKRGLMFKEEAKK